MAYALVSSVAAGSVAGSTITTATITTTGADLLVAVIADYGGGATSTISDSKSNTWTALTTYTDGGLCRLRIFYVASPTVGTLHSFTATVVTGYPSICGMAFSGSLLVAPFDQENGTHLTSGGTTISPGSITPTQDNELIISGLSVGDNSSATVSIDNGMTIPQQVDYAAGAHIGMGAAYKVQTTAAAINPAWTWTGSVAASAGIASFKASAAVTWPGYTNPVGWH